MLISVGAVWMKDLKTPSSAVFPARLIIIPTITLLPPLPHPPKKKKKTKTKTLLRVSTPLVPKSVSIM